MIRLRFGQIWRVMVVISVGLGLGLLLVEILLRLMPGVLPPEIQPNVAQKSLLIAPIGPVRFVQEYRLLWEQDDYLRERMIAGVDTVIHGNPEYPAWPIRTDSLDLGAVGYRDTRPKQPPFALVLGDSFGFGVGVDQAETWSERLEQKTGLPFVNLSQVGASSLQEARIYAKYGRRLQTKVVFWMFFQNDFKDNLRFAAWLEPEANITQAVRLPSHPCSGWVHRGLKRFSIAYELVIYWQRLCDYSAIPPTPVYRDANLNLTFCLDHDICDLDVQARMLADGWPFTRTALLQTKALVEQSGARLVIMIVPSKEQVYWTQFQQVASVPPGYDIDQIVRPVREFCLQEALDCIDLTEPFREQARLGRQLYFPVDIHWNVDGHKLVADVVDDYLHQAGLLP